jgi:XRE family transcriptional regulator, master regulator for biofilm formation
MAPRRFGTVLKTLREEKGLTQGTVAQRAKVTKPYLSQLETGARKNPSVPVLKRLAKALGVTVTALLE